jgi:hypothetical protein
MMRRALKRRIHAIEERLEWRPWLARPMAIWPLHALQALHAESLVRPAILSELSTAQLTELLVALKGAESE